MKSFDLIVIGSGPAGEKAAVKAAYFNYTVALIEKEPDFGGAGVQTGTLPSKTLRETALYLSGIYQKGVFGVDKEIGREVGIKDFMYRKTIVSKEMGDIVKQNLLDHQVEIFSGTASFEDDHHIKVKGAFEEVIFGRNILVATGSYPYHPDAIPFDELRVHDSDSILNIEKFPKSICVLGAGVIGCEYATIFGAMGVKTCMVNNVNRILEFLDNEVSEALVNQMRENGINILFNNSIKDYYVPDDHDKPLSLQLDSGETLNVDMFLYAAGRSGNIKMLQCENAGINIGERETLLVNENYQTNIPHIYAVGDVIGFPALASIGMEQGRVAVNHMLDAGDLEKITEIFPYGIYTVPEVSMVGVTEEEAKEKGINYALGYSCHCDMARGMIVGGQDDGFLKLIFERESKTIIGVHIIGPMATELIHYGMGLVQDQKTLLQVISTVFNYPTLHDLYKYASYDGLGNLKGRKMKKSKSKTQFRNLDDPEK
ncbi:MAG: Si-specific NAD(P)(+) transhydrogenase [Flavobacteriales bacterium]|nr:Si-specific NAD(P)(+) transhydrogenase [Flavobacteriales bacterium]